MVREQTIFKAEYSLSQEVKHKYAKTQNPTGTEFFLKINFNRNSKYY